jgi:diguanylate cyclase (GGDEF)-like protein
MQNYDGRLREAVRAWEERRIWRAFLVTSALLAIVYPLAQFIGAPPGTEPLRVRLAFATFAVVSFAITNLFPKTRRYTRVLLAIEIVAFYVVQGSFLAASQFSPYVVTRGILVLSAVPLIAPTLLDLDLALGSFLISAIVTSGIEGKLRPELVAGPFGSILLACIFAAAVGTITIAARRREIRVRLAVENGLEERLAMLRTRDRLTGIPNADRFNDLCEDAIASAYLRGRSAAVIALDIDRLNDFDSQYGTRTGDALVVEVARRFEAQAGSGVLARIRSERFAVVCKNADAATAEEQAYAMLESLAQPFTIGTSTLYVTAKAGIAIYPADGKTVDELLSRCDYNLRRAREGVHDAAALTSGESDRHLERLRELTEDLRTALANHQFRLYFQPCVESESRRPVSVEALLRWQHPVYGTILPSEFVPLLEANGLIAAVGEWVLREAVRHCAKWRERRELEISVNLSLEQFRDAALFARIRSALDEAHLPGNALILELTESVAMQNVDYALRTMNACRAWGVKFALDDFGTGYSSMSYLKDLPVDEIKIDRSFARGLPGDIGDSAIVRAIITLAHTRGCVVYCEGVERPEQAQWLAREGCDVLQGTAVSEPLSSDELDAWLAAAPTSTVSR